MDNPEKEGVTSMSKRMIGGALVGWLVLLVGVAVAATVFHLLYLPEAAIPWVSGFIAWLGALLCGFKAAKDAKRKGFMKGLWAGVLYVAGYVVLSLIFGGKIRILNSLILLVLSVVGGIFGINTQRKQKNSRKGITRL